MTAPTGTTPVDLGWCYRCGMGHYLFQRGAAPVPLDPHGADAEGEHLFPEPKTRQETVDRVAYDVGRALRIPLYYDKVPFSAVQAEMLDEVARSLAEDAERIRRFLFFQEGQRSLEGPTP